MQKLLLAVLLLLSVKIADVKKESEYLTSYQVMMTKIWFSQVWVNTARFRLFYKYGIIIVPTEEEIPDFTN